jgi:hypothetical protein
MKIRFFSVLVFLIFGSTVYAGFSVAGHQTPEDLNPVFLGNTQQFVTYNFSSDGAKFITPVVANIVPPFRFPFF